MAVDSFTTARDAITAARGELMEQFGAVRLAETAFPVYQSPSPAARWLGWSRVRIAERLLHDQRGESALDLGAGLGAMLPFLAARYRQVHAVDLDRELTAFMCERLLLGNVSVDSGIDGHRIHQLITALDVLEHVDDLAAMYAAMLGVTGPGGRWVISGPTENLLYRTLRRLSGPGGGEGHLRTIHDVLGAVPPPMRLLRTVRLSFGLPAPLFVVALYQRTEGGPATGAEL